MAYLEVKNLSKHFAGVRAVNDVCFDIAEGTISALVGPNGSGKTTIFDIITGFVKPDKGQVIFKGEPIINQKPYRIAQMGLCRTFQLIRLFPKLTCLDNLLLAKPQQGEKFWIALLQPGLVRQEQKANKKWALEFLQLVGLKDKENTLAENLSYGQQKLLEIARSLATEADFLLLDEPMAGVHSKMRQILAKVLQKLKQKGKTVLFIEHNMEMVEGLSDKVIKLSLRGAKRRSNL